MLSEEMKKVSEGLASLKLGQSQLLFPVPPLGLLCFFGLRGPVVAQEANAISAAVKRKIKGFLMCCKCMKT